MKSLRFVTALLALCSFLSLVACTKWGEKKNANWHQATSGERLANLFWKDVKEKKWQQLGAHVAPEFVGTHEMQTLDKPALLDHLSHLDLESFQIGEVQTRSAGGDLMVSYVIALRMRSGGGTATETRLRILSVWQELKHGWVVVAMSAAHAQ